jgi:hypothetical protein
MNARIERPSYFEGQILAAADLEAGVGHWRGQIARHERYLHLWGIAEGLELTAAEKKTANDEKYQEVTVGNGVAVDVSGREIVVAEDTRLPEEAFGESNIWVGQPKDAWFPVFVTGADTAAAAPSLAVGRCGTSESSRTLEHFAFAFGRPGDETEVEKLPGVAEGPGSGLNGTPARVLLGFVQWDAAIGKFTAVKTESSGIGRRYAGARADTVAARGGRVALRTRTEVKAGGPALAIDESDGGRLQFGLLDSAGNVDPALFTVDAKGNVTVEGQVKAAATAGSVQIQSGVAMDGVVLPLPPGVTQKQVDEGKVLVHVHVSPHIPGSPPPTANDIWAASPLECDIDADRRIRCRTRWIRISAAPGVPRAIDHAASCDYTIIVSAPSTEGA